MAQVATLPAEVEQCIENCQDCHRICHEAIPHCLEMGEEHAAPHHIRLLLDCAEICQTANEFMVRGSSFQNRICEVCSEVCVACGRDCERYSDELMRFIAEVCMRCGESCRRVANLK